MKKKFLLCFLFLILLSPALVLAGCGKSEFNVEIGESGAVQFVDFGTFNSSTQETLEPTTGIFKREQTVKYDLVVPNTIDINSIKVFNNGEEIEWTKNANYDSTCIVTPDKFQVAGTVEIKLENCKDDLNLTASASEKKIKFRFKFAEGEELTSQALEIMSDLKIDFSIPLVSIVSDNFEVSLAYSEAVETGIKIYSSKSTGYYKFDKENDFVQDGILKFNSSSGENEHMFSITLKTLRDENLIILNPTAIQVS